jgi:GNAT superfamily N-acetyltransferase
MTLPAVTPIRIEDAEALLRTLRDWNSQFIGTAAFEPLRLGIGVPGNVGAGVVAETGLGWLFIHGLWVLPSLRGQGLGRMIMAEAHAKARQRGCHAALVDTMDWQARPFYEKLGYQVFGELADFPKGHKRFYLQCPL